MNWPPHSHHADVSVKPHRSARTQKRNYGRDDYERGNIDDPIPRHLTISLIIPAYNEEDYLPACLTAAMHHAAGKVIEIIVIDNHSTDRTKQVIERFPSVKYAFESVKGITRARQCGFDASTGDILAYIDADTRMPEGWIERISEHFEANPGLACLSGPYSFYDVDGIRSAISRIWFVIARPIYWMTGYMIVGGNFAIRRDVLRNMGGFNRNIEFYGEDVDIARRASDYGRVLFAANFVMPTSGRRMKKSGFIKTAIMYLMNYFSIVLRKRPTTQSYEDVR